MASKYERQEDITGDGNNRHISGMKILDTDAEEVNEKLWKVKSQSQSPNNVLDTEYYEISFLSSDCTNKDHCNSRCDELACIDLCGHMYYCPCRDKSDLCKHIHKVHSQRLKNG